MRRVLPRMHGRTLQDHNLALEASLYDDSGAEDSMGSRRISLFSFPTLTPLRKIRWTRLSVLFPCGL